MGQTHFESTIAAIATAQGVGGIGIIRISGPGSRGILDRVFRPSSSRFTDYIPWKLHHGHVVDARERILDEVLAVFMPGPSSFTGEDVAELHCHGGSALLAAILDEVLVYARPADRGEFSRRAFLNGRIDLSQAEAVAELISAPSREGMRLAVGKLDGILGRRVRALRESLEALRAQICLGVDFPDDEVDAVDRESFLQGARDVRQNIMRLLASVERTRCWREGIRVALAGPVNAGKSSLMNAFLGFERAIVTPVPGTTRDFLEETVNLAGLPVRLVDTAGMRATRDLVELSGIRLGLDRIKEADIVLLIVDGVNGFSADLVALSKSCAGKTNIIVWNKKDIAPPPPSFIQGTGIWATLPSSCRCAVSAKTGQGIEDVADAIRRLSLQDKDGSFADEVAPNARQAHALETAANSLSELQADVENELPYELCSVRLEEAARALGSVIGLDTADDVLNRIFSTFCIGK